MQHVRRGFIVAGLIAVAAMQIGAGCPYLPKPEVRLRAVTEVDFAELSTFVYLALDVTDLNQGLKTADAVRAAWGGETTAVDIGVLGDLQLTYALLTDAAAGVQTLVLPGTSNGEHLRVDLQTDLVNDETLGVPVHAGFLQIARRVHDDLRPRLQAGYPLVIVGYSLGGAVGCILAAHAEREGVDIARILTLGQPVFTDAAGAAVFGELPVQRLIAGNDPIPRLTDGVRVQFGPAIVLLDGPYVALLPARRPELDPWLNVLINLTDTVLLDHMSYLERIVSKLGVEAVYEVRLEDRQSYLLRPTP